jgi:hypothetical protein
LIEGGRSGVTVVHFGTLIYQSLIRGDDNAGYQIAKQAY